jgi:hypothetical protein
MFTAEIEHETTKLRVTPETQPNSALITRERSEQQTQSYNERRKSNDD